MKAFRVSYTTAAYTIFSELVLAPDEAAIPAHLEAKSDKDFIAGHPLCRLNAAKEIPIQDLPIRDLTIGELFELIDSRIAQKTVQP